MDAIGSVLVPVACLSFGYVLAMMTLPIRDKEAELESAIKYDEMSKSLKFERSCVREYALRIDKLEKELELLKNKHSDDEVNNSGLNDGYEPIRPDSFDDLMK